MSRYVIEYGKERLELDLPEGSEAAVFTPPEGMAEPEAEAALREALEQPRNYPPLRRNVVPGDRVAIALDADLPEPKRVLDVVTEVLEGAGVDPEAITIVEAARNTGELLSGQRGEVAEVHDPTSRDRLAYLSTTKSGARVYLNRTLTDADVVIPVGLLRQDPLTGPHGPWSVLFPGLSDAETREARRRSLALDPRGAHFLEADAEAFEVGWLLGSQFQVGIVPGSRGPAGFVAGLAEDVRDAGLAVLDKTWTFRPDTRAELVVVGVGGNDGPAGLHDLIAALATANRLVQRGGRIVALSQVEGAFGPALQRLIAAGDRNDSRAVLRGHEDAPDFLQAQMLAHILDWADVYVASRLDADALEELSMVPLDRPEDARRLASRASSCLVVGRADRVRAMVRDDQSE
ncbi:lactate racemase domain-containing protein [Paludisphaera rhizosphaerae]|uniref:lactate racemase domain-containing protein n=1 Tax=Paludisphaera rhizosphaerae TaxID=2711216 RepID=UPI0013EB1517|nr:lactate racemase domain-containing protein [Paludisphaera rhizosphaerae]